MNELFWGLATVLAVTVLFEFACHFTWNQSYFRSGIPLYRREIPLREGQPNPLAVARLQRQCMDGPASGIAFEKISTNEIAFRRSLDPFSHPSTLLSHGVITSDPQRGAIVITAYLDWYLLAIPLVLLAAHALLAVATPALPLAYWQLLNAFDQHAYGRLEKAVSALAGHSIRL